MIPASFVRPLPCSLFALTALLTLAPAVRSQSPAWRYDYNAAATAVRKTICEDDKDLPIQKNAKKVLRELEKQADNRLAHARKMEDQGQTLEAIDTLGDLMRVYAGTPAANEAKGLLTALAAKPEIRERQRSRRARELLAQARDEFRTQQFYGCLEKCELIAANYPDLPEGLEASQLAG